MLWYIFACNPIGGYNSFISTSMGLHHVTWLVYIIMYWPCKPVLLSFYTCAVPAIPFVIQSNSGSHKWTLYLFERADDLGGSSLIISIFVRFESCIRDICERVVCGTFFNEDEAAITIRCPMYMPDVIISTTLFSNELPRFL